MKQCAILLETRRGMLRDPAPIHAAGHGQSRYTVISHCRSPIAPLVNFGVAVRHGKSTSEVVISGGPVNPLGGLHADGKACVVEAVGVFVEQDERVPRAGNNKGADLAVGVPRLAASMAMLVVQPRTVNWQFGAGRIRIGAHRLAHGKRSHWWNL